VGLVKFNGTITTFNKMIKSILKKLFCLHKDQGGNKWGRLELTEGMYADEYRCPEFKKQITDRYKQMYFAEPTPFSNPENYDPLTPPHGWRWDPYYECWIKTE